jgi:hypothetical protein
MRFVAFALALAGCTRGEVTHSERASAPSAAAKPTGPILVPPRPPEAEVELSGKVTLPRAAKGDVMVYVTDRACWREGAHAFGQTKIADPAQARFFVEIFVPQGTSLWVCAAVVEDKKPIVFHGELARAPLAGNGLGEVVFHDLTLAIAKGAPVSLPKAAGAAP